MASTIEMVSFENAHVCWFSYARRIRTAEWDGLRHNDLLWTVWEGHLLGQELSCAEYWKKRGIVDALEGFLKLHII